jgi:hypothetical protein
MAHEVPLITADDTGPDLAEAAGTCIDPTAVVTREMVQAIIDRTG